MSGSTPRRRAASCRYDASADTYAISDEMAAILADDDVAHLHGARDERAAFDVRRRRQAAATRTAATARWAGRITTRACSAGPSGSSARATARSSRRRGSPRSTGVETKLQSGRPRRRRRLRSWRVGRRHGRRRTRTRPSTASTSTPRRSRRSKTRAEEAGVSDRTEFAVADAKGYPGTLRPDLLLRLPARHG